MIEKNNHITRQLSPNEPKLLSANPPLWLVTWSGTQEDITRASSLQTMDNAMTSAHQKSLSNTDSSELEVTSKFISQASHICTSFVLALFDIPDTINNRAQYESRLPYAGRRMWCILCISKWGTIINEHAASEVSGEGTVMIFAHCHLPESVQHFEWQGFLNQPYTYKYKCIHVRCHDEFYVNRQFQPAFCNLCLNILSGMGRKGLSCTREYCYYEGDQLGYRS